MQWPDILDAFRASIETVFSDNGVIQADGSAVPVFLGLPARAPNRDAVYIWRKSTQPNDRFCRGETTRVYIEVWTRPAHPSNTSSDLNEQNVYVMDSWQRLAQRTALIKSIEFGKTPPLYACTLTEQLDDGGQFHPAAAERLEYVTYHNGEQEP